MESYYYYLNKKANRLENIATHFIDICNLEPNFDIIKLLSDFSIEVKPAKLPFHLEYAFGFENEKFIIYYDEKITDYRKNEINKSKKISEFMKKDLRFILTQALADILIIYRLDEQNLYKVEYENNTYYRSKPSPNAFFNNKHNETEYLAACLLMPQERLKKEFYKITDNYNNDVIPFEVIEKLSDYFGCNKKAIKQRCKVLNLIW